MFLNPKAPAFVPRMPIQILRSARYMGNPADVENIKTLFAQLPWPAGTTKVYITNGWHAGFENGRWVDYCGYSINVDDPIYKQHYYR